MSSASVRFGTKAYVCARYFLRPGKCFKYIDQCGEDATEHVYEVMALYPYCVLLRDTRNGVKACPFHMADFNFNLCLATRNDSIRTISKVSHEGFKKLAGRPEWCPLKELPEKLETSTRDNERCGQDAENKR
jgi:hypothetical protein